MYFFSSLEHPIRQNISNWSDVTNILEHLLENELHINDSEHPVMLTEMGQTSRRQREKLTEVLVIICISLEFVYKTYLSTPSLFLFSDLYHSLFIIFTIFIIVITFLLSTFYCLNFKKI